MEKAGVDQMGSGGESGLSNGMGHSLDVSGLSGIEPPFDAPKIHYSPSDKYKPQSFGRPKNSSVASKSPDVEGDLFGHSGKHERAKSGFSTTVHDMWKNGSLRNSASPEPRSINKKITEEDEEPEAPEETACYKERFPAMQKKLALRLPAQLSDCHGTQGSTASQDRKGTLLVPEHSASHDPDNYEEFQYTVLQSKQESQAIFPDNDAFQFNRFRDTIRFGSLTPENAKIISSYPFKSVEGGKEKTLIVLAWSDGTLYQGELKGSLFHGQGHLKHSGGYRISGEFKEGNVEGFATLVQGPLCYEGQWINSCPEGQGKEKLAGVYDYEGSFIQGRKSGRGVMKVVGRGEFDGFFKDNMFNGEGRFTWSNGKKYEGFWYNNRMHGKGKMTWPDGRKYFGRYNNNQKEGFGRFVWADGREYIGYWRHGKQDGKAWYIDINGIKHDTLWENGDRIA